MAQAPDRKAPDVDAGLTLDQLEHRIYQVIAFGFPLLTLAIITGAVWAERVWQHWWQWDPKETSALVSWLIYAAYLHGRNQRGWRGSTSAGFAVGGFAAILFCYAGVTFLGGMHAYGNPQAGRLSELGGWEGMDPTEMVFTIGYLIAYVAALVAYVWTAVARGKSGGALATSLATLGLLAQTTALVLRGIHAGRLPFTSGYDFSVCFVWGIMLCYVVLERIIKTRAIGPLVLGVALLISLYGYLWFPQKGVQPLPPALQNGFWLCVHVALAIIAYGALALSAASGVMYFWRAKREGSGA